VLVHLSYNFDFDFYTKAPVKPPAAVRKKDVSSSSEESDSEDEPPAKAPTPSEYRARPH